MSQNLRVRKPTSELGRLYGAFFRWLDGLSDGKRQEVEAIWKKLDANKPQDEAKDMARLQWMDACVKHGFVKP